MFNLKGKKYKAKLATLLVMVLTFIMPTMAFASEAPDNADDNIIYHNETWVAPNKHIEVTVYDLGDGYTSTETITTEDVTSGLLRASGTKTQSSTVEIKNGKTIAATVTVSATFSYDGKTAIVVDSSHSKSIKTGYSEKSYSELARDMSLLYGDAMANTSLSVKDDSTGKAYAGLAVVYCGKNG